jgi:hypothetical protein
MNINSLWIPFPWRRGRSAMAQAEQAEKLWQEFEIARVPEWSECAVGVISEHSCQQSDTDANWDRLLHIW